MPTIYKTLLAKGYFPKELPPAFFSEDFATYATSKPGRALLSSYTPPDKFTEVVRYRLALPGRAVWRRGLCRFLTHGRLRRSHA